MRQQNGVVYTKEVGLVDFLFPKRCVNCRRSGSYLCSACFVYLSYDPERICLLCNKASWNGLTHPPCVKRWGIDGSFSALAYNGVVKKLIFSFKYKPFVSDLHAFLGELFYEGIIQNEHFMKRIQDDTFFIPIPLHSEKKRRRGYNHAALLAKEIGDKMDIKVIDSIIRMRKTKSQFLLKKEEREENLRDAFVVKKECEKTLKNTIIFLIDDLVTTGTTMKEAAKALKKAGAKEVYGLTLAHGH